MRRPIIYKTKQEKIRQHNKFRVGIPVFGGRFRDSGHGSGAGSLRTGGSADRPGDMGFAEQGDYLGQVHKISLGDILRPVHGK